MRYFSAQFLSNQGVIEDMATHNSFSIIKQDRHFVFKTSTAESFTGSLFFTTI